MKPLFHAALLGAALVGLVASAPPAAEAKTTKECVAEWRANKATLQASGKTRRAYIAECRGPQDSAAATPARRSARLVQGQFATEAEAKASCPTDTVVWINRRTKVFHTSDSASYGKTKRGAYMCQKDTAAAGYRAPKGKRAGVQ
jgi:hypothetical protein